MYLGYAGGLWHTTATSMLTGELRNQIERIWDAFWSGGISNPLEIIEQITYLLFLRRLDDLQTLEENKVARLKRPLERRYFTGELRTVAQPTLNIKQLSETPVVLPPIELQREFERRVAAVEKLKSAQRASLVEMDVLFAVLQHRAFRGEL
ncbi:type I restriction-modification system subunit M N-terminal domain-containing protein [Archangium sp.]|uniref:type I restriction-modification system subunit M N-terminal domain-containing protein n=1 Tax=Archangium sp. TaxID=1872627 RepID=UPI00389AC66C